MAPRTFYSTCSIVSVTMMVPVVFRNEPIVQIDRTLSLRRCNRDERTANGCHLLRGLATHCGVLTISRVLIRVFR